MAASRLSTNFANATKNQEIMKTSYEKSDFPVDGIRRAVVQSENDHGVRVLPLDALDAPLDRDALALIVEIGMAVMRMRGGRCHADSRCQNHQISFHAGGLQRSSTRAHTIWSPDYRFVTCEIARHLATRQE